MRRFILITILFVGSHFTFGQNTECTFHEGLSLETALIFPLPFGVIPEADGGLGINEDARIGQEFSFKWTMIWPDSFSSVVTGGIAYTDTVQFFLDQTIWVFGGDTVGIPEGLSFSITPENGIALPSSDAPVACILLSGTPSENVTPGDYLMFFSFRPCITIPALTIDGCQEDQFIPSIISGFPGEYRLTIGTSTSTKETLNDQVSLQVSPNPFSLNTFIEFNSSDLSADYMLEIFDINGRKVKSESVNLKSRRQRIEINATHLEDGLYIFQLRGEQGIITGKMVVQK